MLEAGRTQDHTFSEPDLLIAALAAQAELIVVSRDTSEFVAAGVPVFDPCSWALHVGHRVLPVADADRPDALAKATALIVN